jgi:hypothetical protein
MKNCLPILEIETRTGFKKRYAVIAKAAVNYHTMNCHQTMFFLETGK